MATFYRARVKETTTTTGTGTMQLLGAVTGYQTFLSPFGNGARCYYMVIDGSAWEYGLGTINASSQLARTLLIASTTGSLLSLSAGTKNVYCALIPQSALNNGTNTFGDGDTTPSVKAGNIWVANNTGATTITMFDDPIDGQIITLIFSNSNTTVQHNTNVRLSGGANFTGTVNDTMRLLCSNNGTAWYEVCRSVNT